MATRAACFLLLFASLTAPASADLTIEFDYSYDSNNFFGAPGSAQRTALQAVGSFFEQTFSQTFAAITPGGINNWNAQFLNPGTGGVQSISNPMIGANTIRIYVGGRELGNTLGVGGRGGFNASGTSTWVNSITRGNSASQYGLWGGSATFNTNASVDWNFDVATGPSSTQDDFFSVALHEIGHVLGISASSPAWDDHWIAGTDTVADSNPGTFGQFTGTYALAAYNADNGLSAAFVPTVTAMLDDPGTPENEQDLTNRHFAENTMSYIYGTTILQEVSLDPNITTGTRKLFTNVDVGAMRDLGWQVTAIPEPSSLFFSMMIGCVLLVRRQQR